MSKVSILNELQKVDLQIEGRQQELDLVLEQLADESALLERRQAVEETTARVEALDKRRQSLDWESSDLQEKIAPLDMKLYSGQLKAPKELVSLQQDVDMLKGQLRQIEDAELQVMVEMDEVQGQLQQQTTELKDFEAQWAEDHKGLLETRDSLFQEIAVLQGQRDSTASQVDVLTLGTYERIRTNRQGVAVASVQRGSCGGCRITIPAIEVQRARSGRDLVFCQSCGRILFIT